MKNKQKAWRQLGAKAQADNKWTARQQRAFLRQVLKFPSNLMLALLQRAGVLEVSDVRQAAG